MTTSTVVSRLRTARPAGPGRPPNAQVAQIIAVLVLAGAIAVLVWHTLVSDTPLSARLAASLGLGQGLALLLVLRAPLTAWLTSFAVLVVSAVAVGDTLWVDATFYSHLVVLAAVGALVNRWTALALWLLTAAAGLVLVAVTDVAQPLRSTVEAALLTGLVLTASGALRRLVDTRRDLAAEQDRVAQQRTRGAVLEERARIARELHDVVAHHMSVVAIQAESARFRGADPAPELAATLEVIRSNAVDALAELRRVLDVLRAEQDAGVEPQPGLFDVPALVANVNAAGVDVAASIRGNIRSLPAGVELSAYRIAQEALSNVVRHAPGAAAKVTVDYGPESVAVTVDNDPGAPRTSAGRSPGDQGHGLIGMAERARLLGGTLESGPTAGGGHRVHAVLPVGAGTDR